MKAESERILEILNNNAALTAIVGTKVFPLIADQEAKLPFVNFHISEDPTYSKEGKIEVIVTVTSFDKTYFKVTELADVVKAAFEDPIVTEVFYYLGGTPGYNEEKLISITQNYKFKF